MKRVGFNIVDFESMLKTDKSDLLVRLDFLLKLKQISVLDITFCFNKFLENGCKNEAILFLRRATECYPDNIELKKRFFNILFQSHFFEEAILVGSALMQVIQDFEVIYSMGLMLEKIGDTNRALRCYIKAYSLGERNLKIYKSLSRLYKKIGRFDLNLKVLEEGLKFFPSDIDLLLVYANEQFVLQNFTISKKVYEKILKIDKNFIAAYVNLGVTCKELKIYDEAKKYYLKAIELDPKNSGAYNNLGVLHKVEKNFFNSFVALKKSLMLNSKNVDAYANLGVILKETNKPSWALVYFEKALQLNPLHVNANVDYAIALMLLGDYKKGLIHYQYRIKMREFLPKLKGLDLKLFYKKGDSIENKKILVFAEQGFGDAIQFVRYLHVLKQKGAYVILRIRKELKKLFDANKLADCIICEGEDIEYDYHMQLLSIPYLFDIDPKEYKTAFSYLKIDKKVKKTKKQKIAFAYSGSPTHKGHLQRFIEPENFSFLTSLPNTEIYLIQKGDNTLLKKCEFYKKTIDKTDEINDFYDTASLISNMDLVITSDTSIAHLGGALGIKTWVCLPVNPDWRWGRNAQETFWYPSIKLFRQKFKGKWNDVFREIQTFLRKD